MNRFARCLIRPRTIVQQSRAQQSRSTSTSTSSNAAVLTNLRDLLDSNPAAAEELAKQLGSTVCLGLASSVQKYTHANPESNVSVAPPYGKLKAVFVGSAVPFVGFGIIDNAVMLVAGDQIDMTLGVSLGISTLAAAGLGNLLSDVGGVWAGGAIEKSSAQLGLAAPMLTRAEENHQRTKATENLGSAVGVAVGCLIGMLPLLLIDSNKAQTMKRKASTESIFKEVFEQVHDLLHADRATLFLVSEDKSHLYSLVGNDRGEQNVLNRVNIPIDNSVAGICVLEKKSLRVENAYKHPKFFGEVDRQTGFQTTDLLCAPIVNSDNEIIGVIQVVNSLREEGFAARDESLLNAFSAHIGITLASLTASDDDHRVEMKEALRLIKNQKRYLDHVERLL